MILEDIKLGSLHEFIDEDRILYEFQDPTTEYFNILNTTRVLPHKEPFVPIQLFQTKIENLVRLKILLTDGTFWYIATKKNGFRGLRKVSQSATQTTL